MTIDGSMYKMAPVGTMIRCHAQKAIAEDRKRLWQEAVAIAKEIGSDMGKDLLVEAYRMQQHTVIPTINEALTWLASPEGDRVWFSKSVTALQPSLSKENIDHLYDRATAMQLNRWREFQFAAWNPEGVQSTIASASIVAMGMDDIPEHLQEHVTALVELARRMV